MERISWPVEAEHDSTSRKPSLAGYPIRFIIPVDETNEETEEPVNTCIHCTSKGRQITTLNANKGKLNIIQGQGVESGPETITV